MWDIIAWLIVGGLAGWVASMIMKTDAQMGALANIVVGIIGALVGGWLARVLFGMQVDPNGLNFWSILIAIGGSVLLLAVLKLLKR
jgi:uncharacterized membrane protein YeaQ/YmgE (transglycosylase-associated protein family)